MPSGRRRRWRLPELQVILWCSMIVVSCRILWIHSSSSSFNVLEDSIGFGQPSSVVPKQHARHHHERDVQAPNIFELRNSSSNNNQTLYYRHPNFQVNFPLCLVHVGKAAGSSVSCGLGLTYADCEGMPRDRLPHTHFLHLRRNNCPKHDTRTYVVTLRNPLTRLQSWFEFEKDIVPISRGPKAAQDQIRQQRERLFQECYTSFTDFCVKGLQSLANQTVITATKPKDMTCPERAWAAALGVRAFSYHEWYNYEYYWTEIQKHGYSTTTQSTAAQLYVLRTEHLKRDWRTLSLEDLFRPVNRKGGRGNNNTTNQTMVHRSEGFLEAATKTNATEFGEALKQLCRALCPEIQIYKRILAAAVNLNPRQRNESIIEIRSHCPSETIEVRNCPDIPSFPRMKVPARQYRNEAKKRLYEIA